MADGPSFAPFHHGLAVRNLDAAMRFWVNGLGFEIGPRDDIDQPIAGMTGEVRITAQFIKNNNDLIELLHFISPPVPTEPMTGRVQLGLSARGQRRRCHLGQGPRWHQCRADAAAQRRHLLDAGLDGKRVIVAGGATGIGAATAERVAGEGATVVTGDVNSEQADQEDERAPKVSRSG